MRTAGIILSALTVFALGLVAFLVGAWMASTNFSDRPGFLWSYTLPVAAGLMTFGGWWVASGLGLARMKAWAKISMLAIGAFLLVAAAFGALDMVLDPSAGVTYLFEGTDRASFRPEMTAFYALLAAFGTFWLIFFSRSSIKSRFSP